MMHRSLSSMKGVFNFDKGFNTKGKTVEPLHNTGAVMLLIVLLTMTASVAALPEALFASSKGGVPAVIEKRISNGPRLVMEPRKGSGMVCISVVVSAGSALEEPSMRGISHFMEHMAFDGSERYSRRRINGWADETGSFLNAFTREEYTVYFTLIPTSQIEDGFDILSQMLLHSVLPGNEIEKEKKVITEEMHKDEDNLNTLRDEIVKRHLYVGSPMAESIIGTPATVLAFTREDLLDYYKRAYDPRRMMVYLLGDFNESSAEKLTLSYFRLHPYSADKDREDEEAEDNAHADDAAFERGAPPPLYRDEMVNVEKEGMDEGLDILVSLPIANSTDLAASIVLPELLNRPDGPLDVIRKKLSIEKANVDVEFHRNFSALRFHFKGLNCDRKKIDGAVEALKALASQGPAKDDLSAARLSVISQDMFDMEKFHYYVMLKGENIAALGIDYINALRRGVREVSERDCSALLHKTFKEMHYNGCYIHPCKMPQKGLVRSSSSYKVLKNGCAVVACSRDDSNVFALSILFKNPSCIESKFGPGAVSLLHHLYENSAAGIEFAKKLSSLGAEVAWGDNPFIPFDDYLVNPSASFITLLAPASQGKVALSVLVDYLRSAVFTDEDIKSVVPKLFMEKKIRSRYAGYTIKKVILKTLFPDHPYSFSIYPAPSYLHSINAAKIDEFRKDYLTGANMVVSIVSPMTKNEAFSVLSSSFSAFPAGKDNVCPSFESPIPMGESIEKKSPFESLYLEKVWLVRSGSGKEKAALYVTADVLSTRMQERLREERGLAYSTGCGIIPLKGASIVDAYIGTSADRRMVDSLMVSCIKSLVFEPPTAEELSKAAKRIIGSRLRRELSSANRAYENAFDLITVSGAGKAGKAGESTEEKTFLDFVNSVSKNSAARIANEYLDAGKAVSIDFVPGAGRGEEKK